MKRKHTIKVPIYDDLIKVKIVNKIKGENNCDAYVLRGKNSIKLLIKPDATPMIIAHESVHICNFIFERIYAEVDINNDEPYAYLLGWVVEQITNILNKINTP